jgi:hypothetical protein
LRVVRLPHFIRLLAIAALATLGAALPAEAQAACNTAPTLSGTYALNVTGSTTAGVSKFLTGMLTFSTSCTVTGTIAVGENYVAAPFAPLYAGSYAINTDGSIALSLTLQQGAAPETYAIGYSQAFNDAVGAEMDNSAVATIELKPLLYPATAPALSYTNATLAGTYVASCAGRSATYTDLNAFTFDGSSTNGVGNIISGVDYYNNYGQAGLEPYVGQYSVAANGTFTGNVTVGGAQYGVTGVIDFSANEIQFLYSAAGGDITACSAKRVTAAQSMVTSCHVTYANAVQNATSFNGTVTISNTGTTTLTGWTLTWNFANGQKLSSTQNATAKQSGTTVTLTNLSSNGTIPPGGSTTGIGFTASWNKTTNAAPTSFAVNGVSCS